MLLSVRADLRPAAVGGDGVLHAEGGCGVVRIQEGLALDRAGRERGTGVIGNPGERLLDVTAVGSSEGVLEQDAGMGRGEKRE